jgi:Zn-dependent protease with chaperone function
MSNVPINPTLHESLLAPSPEFKKEATRSIIAIVAFIAVYFLLFALSLVLVGACFYGGLTLIALKPSFYTLLIGGGIVGCGVMIFFFLIKFLFASTKVDNSDSVEITHAEHPKLVETIYALAEATGTPKPKRIFLSADVNASVFYNSSFWSMFFPIRKNLKIGLGLVNTLNVSELKAVIAHEFGHFSQRSMKVGSWVYQVNKIIYDMLFNNQGYVNSLASIASVHGIIAFFVQLTIQLVKAIQWVLHGMYKVVNKSYFGLSRQMEFHADLVAATVCGSNNIVSALKRSEFADVCLNATLDVCSKAWQEKKMVSDFYAAHRVVVKHLAHLNNMNLENGLPVIIEDGQTAVTPRVNYKDQWASHPTLQERRANLEPYGLVADVEAASAWTLFANEASWKEELTKQFYKSVSPADVNGLLDITSFEQLYTGQIQRFSFPPLFKEFYNNHVVTKFDPEAAVHQPFVMKPFKAVLDEEGILLPKRLQYLEQDIAVLKGIQNKEIVTSSFDFDGKKYSRKDATVILEQLEREKDEMQERLVKLDQLVFRYFYAIAPLPEAEQLKEAYITYYAKREKVNALLVDLNRLMDRLGPVFRGETLTIEGIQEMISDVKENHEPAFKKALNEWLSAGAFDADANLKAVVEKFTLSQYEYFAGNSFFDNELIELNNLVQDSWNGISNYVFSLFKSIAETQAALQEKKQGQAIAG